MGQPAFRQAHVRQKAGRFFGVEFGDFRFDPGRDHHDFRIFLPAVLTDNFNSGVGHALADFIDDSIDRINSCAKRIAIYNPKHSSTSELELGKIVAETAKSVDLAMGSLSQLRKNVDTLKKQIELLHTLENKADEIYEDAITQLFAEESDPIELMKTKEILYELEKTTDAAERIGKILKTIIVKYA